MRAMSDEGTAVTDPDTKRALPSGLRPWKPGQSGGGHLRPRTPESVRDLARSFSDASLRRLAALAGVAPGGVLVKTKAPESVQLAATEALLNRAWGRPDVAVHVTGGLAGPLADATPAESARVLAMLLDAARAEIAAESAPVLADVVVAPTAPEGAAKP